MAETTLAAVKVAPSTTEVREFPLPDIPDDAALMKVEVAGICGTDVKNYGTAKGPIIMGHENIGRIYKAGKTFLERKGVKEGDLVFLEHYLPCMKCEWCHIGEYRHCSATDWHHNPNAIRYGYTTADVAPSLWGGFARYLYLPWNAIIHKVPDNVSPELAGIATPMSNGVQWTLFEAGIGYGSTVLIQGPGQQGLCQVVTARQAGADLVVISGTSRDRKRLEVAKELGADVIVNVDEKDVVEEVRKATSGKGVDVVIDCTAGAGTKAFTVGLDALRAKGGTMVIQGELKKFPDFPMEDLTLKYVTVKSARGHSWKSCELALQQLASHRFPIEKALTHNFGLDQVDLAIRSVGGTGEKDAIHVNVHPWKTASQN